jgi:hypothetical protein
MVCRPRGGGAGGEHSLEEGEVHTEEDDEDMFRDKVTGKPLKGRFLKR